MRANPVVNYSCVIRVQSMYSEVEQEVITRCLLEIPVIGERRGFGDVEALLVALRADLKAMEDLIIPHDKEIT